MSILHTVSWYERHHRRHPDLALWPIATAVTPRDVLMAGESMAACAQAVGTPCTRVGRRPASRNRADHARQFCAVVVTTVETVWTATDGGAREVWVDAELDGCEPLAYTMRLIGRASRCGGELFTVRPSRRHGELRAWLPNDLHSGDLVAFVVDDPVSIHDIRRRR